MISRGRRRFWILLFLVGLYAVLGYFVLPPFARTELQKRMSAELGRTVSIGAVRIDPFAFSIALEGVQIMKPDGAEPFAGWRRLHANFDPLRSLRGDWVLGEISLQDFRGVVEIDENGTPSFSDLLERFGTARAPEPEGFGPPAKRSRPWRVSRIAVSGAQVDFVDRSRQEVFRTLLGPVNFTLLEFRTAGGHGAPYRFEARSESGERLNWTGSLTARPLTSSGEWRLENVLLSKYAPYFDDQLNLLLTSGKLTLSGRYDVSFLPDDRRVSVTEGAGQLTGLKLVERATGQPLLEVANGELTGFSVDGLQRRITLGTLRLNGGRMAVRRESDGTVNLSGLLRRRTSTDLVAGPAVAATPTTPTTPTPTSPTAAVAAEGEGERKPFEVTASEIGLREFVVHWHDASTPRPVDVELTGFNATAREFTSTAGAAVPIEASFAFKPQGTARATGTVALQPLRVNVDLEFAWVPLPPFSGYLENAAPVRLSHGVASVKGRLALAASAVGLETTFSGGGRLEETVLASALGDEELGGFSNLALNEVNVTTAPRLSVSLGALSLSAPFVRLAIDQNGAFNLAQLKGPPTTADALAAVAPDATAPTASRLDLSIGRLTLDGGELSFRDESLQPGAQIGVSQIGGTLQNLSSRNPARGEVDLRAFVGGEGPLLVRGRFNPLAATAFADLAVEAKSVDLSPAGPYIAKYTGYEFERGTLSMVAQAKLVEQRLDVRSTVTLEEFALGDPAPSPDALKLPVRLGVALLQDANGRIALEVPVRGSLADPHFRPGQAIGRVVTDVLARAATSPFALIGSMFGGGGEELRYQEFPLGESVPTLASVKRLEVLRRALVERPALRLELEPSYDPGELYELKRKTLEAEVRRRVWERLRAEDARVPPIDELLISSSNRADAITAMFDERFGRPRPRPAPPPTTASVFPANSVQTRTGPAEPRPVPPEPAPPPPRAAAEPREEKRDRPGLFRRAWNAATLKGLRDRVWGEDEDEEAASEPPPRDESPTPATEPLPQEQPPPPAVEAAPQEAAGGAPAPEQLPPVAVPSEPEPPPLDVPLSEMERRLIDAMEIGAEDLVALAQTRAERVKELLTRDERVAANRVSIRKPDPNAAAPQGPRVTLHLK